MKKQTQYFTNGIILLVLGLLSVTLIPFAVQKSGIFSIENYVWVEIEFFLLGACSLYYLFSPKYYRAQVSSILYAIICYFIFVHIADIFK